MNRLLAIVGLGLTAAYLVTLWLFLAPRAPEVLALAPNNVGDLLAGVFGPVAILWLILGFFQQGIELRQNTQALHLQAEELRNSVEQQRQLGRTNARAGQDGNWRVARKSGSGSRRLPGHALFFMVSVRRSVKEAEYKSRVKNIGNTATEVTFTFELPVKRCSHTVVFSWSRGEEQPFSWVYMTPVVEAEAVLTIAYVDAGGFPGTQQFCFVPERGSAHAMVRIEHMRV